MDAELVLVLGGPPARWVVTGAPSGPTYWLRVWALRGLLWARGDSALPSVETALHDDAWRLIKHAVDARSLPGCGLDASAGMLPRYLLCARPYASLRRSATSGIRRAVLVWYSAKPGIAAATRAHVCT